MTVPIVFLYAVGVLFFIFGIEEDETGHRNIIYLGISFFVNLIGYYSSYSDTDFVSLAYIPLALLAITTLLLVYKVWMLIPVSESWDNEAEREED